MKGLWEYIVRQINVVPQTVIEVLLSLFVIGSVILLALYGKKAMRRVSGLLLSEYLFFIYGITVIYRTTNAKLSHFFTPFSSYKSLLQGETPPLLYEMFMNVVLFVPVGLLLGPQMSKRTARQKWLIVFLVGMGLSIGIELLQLAFQKGSCEIDDIMHNTVGCLIGFLIWQGIIKMIELLKRTWLSTNKN